MALEQIAETLATERLEAWDQRLRRIDAILRGEKGDDGLVHTVNRLASLAEKHELILYGSQGSNGIIAMVHSHREFITFSKRVFVWLLTFLVLNFAAILTFLFQFIWTQVTGNG